MAAVIRTTGSHLATPAETDRANTLLKDVLRALLPAHSEGIKAFVNPYAPGVDRRGVLRALIAMYHAIFGLPAPDDAMVLRHFASGVKK